MTDIPHVTYQDMHAALLAAVKAHRDASDLAHAHARAEHAARYEREQVLVARRKLEQQQVTARG